MMKFKNRVVLTLMLGLLFFSGVGVLIYSNRRAHYNYISGHLAQHLDIHAIRRSLNMAESNSREIPGLLSQILDQSPFADSHSQVWQSLLRNKSVAEAWIKVGNILEQHKLNQNENNQYIVNSDDIVVGDQWYGYRGNQSYIMRGYGTLNDSMVQDLANILYKSLVYTTSNRKHHNLEEHLQMAKKIVITRDSASNIRFHAGISRHSLYSDLTMVDDLLRDMVLLPIKGMSQMDGGTQIKLLFSLADNRDVIFKPMRFSRAAADTLPNHFYFSDYERHTAEIAAFHLDRLLDFRKVPPVAGRVVNITHDIRRFASAHKKFEKTIFTSPAGNICFHGKCDYYCDTGHAICGHPELLEGSVAVFLPSKDLAKRNKMRHPWRRSYSKRHTAKWETDPEFCDLVKTGAPYTRTKSMLDIMDIAVFDFLIGNMDRHHYELFSDFQNNTFTLLFDNGRGFGKPGYDELTILAPIYQCCMFRASTLHKLLNLQTGEKLSVLMQRSLANDLLPDVLTPRHLAALDRRVQKILLILHICVTDNGGDENVIIDDGF